MFHRLQQAYHGLGHCSPCTTHSSIVGVAAAGKQLERREAAVMEREVNTLTKSIFAKVTCGVLKEETAKKQAEAVTGGLQS